MRAALGPLAFAIFVACASSKASAPPPANITPAPACAGDECLPSVAMVDTAGRVHTTETLSGKIVIVNFWATWAKASLTPVPMLARIHDKYAARDVVLLGVLTQSADETLSEFLTTQPVPYPVVKATEELLTAYGYPQNMPTTFVFDRRGKRVALKVGSFTEPGLTALLEKLLAAGP